MSDGNLPHWNADYEYELVFCSKCGQTHCQTSDLRFEEWLKNPSVFGRDCDFCRSEMTGVYNDFTGRRLDFWTDDEEKTMNNTYTCPICGKVYESPTEMAACIMECDRKQKETEAREKAEILKKEQENRKAEIREANARLKDLVEKYREDYNDPFIIDEANIPQSVSMWLTRYNNSDIINSLFRQIVDDLG